MSAFCVLCCLFCGVLLPVFSAIPVVSYPTLRTVLCPQESNDEKVVPWSQLLQKFPCQRARARFKQLVANNLGNRPDMSLKEKAEQLCVLLRVKDEDRERLEEWRVSRQRERGTGTVVVAER